VAEPQEDRLLKRDDKMIITLLFGRKLTLSKNIKILLKLAGFGLIIFGVTANLPAGWAMLSVGAGLAGLIASGGGGG